MHLTRALRRERLAFILFALCAFLSSSMIHADPDVVSVFPLTHYDQNLSNFIKPNDADYDTPLLSAEAQLKRLSIFYNRTFGESSPWNADYINRIIQEPAPNDLASIERNIIADFNNTHHSGTSIQYGENFRPHTEAWINEIADNINASQFMNPSYHANQRGIAIDNLHARALPTDDVSFYSHTLAGQGYPFDNLQMSALWAGTPVYILGETRDHEWMLVISPDYVAWVKANGIAYVDEPFIKTWSAAARKKMAAITQTKTAITDERQHFILSTYVGSVFPATESENGIKLMIPVADNDRQAMIKSSVVSREAAAIMPLTATPHHFATIMRTLIGRPYGWGGLYFYNDCSAELKSLFAPFGIWLPRHSSDQVYVGKIADLTNATPPERIDYLQKNGRKFLSLIYIGGHVVLYVGNAPMPMTYQNMWGLSPKPAIRRAVIGQSVLLPLLGVYPEDTSLTSQAAKKYFQVSYLDELPNEGNLLTIEPTTLRSLMTPELTE